MNLRAIDWIWHIRGSLPLAPGQSGDAAFDRLDGLFRQAGTSHHRTRDTLTFTKKDQAAQDRMSIFDGGVLRIEQGPKGTMLRYNLTSRALLFCFLAPLLFLAFAQVTVMLRTREVAKALSMPDDDADGAKKRLRKALDGPMNPIDAALGAPAPEKPKDDEDKDKSEGARKKYSPTPAYVFAAIFAVLYVAGRILEAHLARRLFRKSLHGPDPAAAQADGRAAYAGNRQPG